ncbi:uncharacterized protein DDB_G0290587-like [Phlebotomus argentipes]|uniref:uncharacterized protein DDB_G0290587-like n=1 Tax=Phlebotomus argentipes TaxID=94469 RepID=UPI002892F081|nr:uncharacterized protein DDB_G0290587-like [Phlebotomus argentipes]
MRDAVLMFIAIELLFCFLEVKCGQGWRFPDDRKTIKDLEKSSETEDKSYGYRIIIPDLPTTSASAKSTVDAESSKSTTSSSMMSSTTLSTIESSTITSSVSPLTTTSATTSKVSSTTSSSTTESSTTTSSVSPSTTTTSTATSTSTPKTSSTTTTSSPATTTTITSEPSPLTSPMSSTTTTSSTTSTTSSTTSGPFFLSLPSAVDERDSIIFPSDERPMYQHGPGIRSRSELSHFRGRNTHWRAHNDARFHSRDDQKPWTPRPVQQEQPNTSGVGLIDPRSLNFVDEEEPDKSRDKCECRCPDPNTFRPPRYQEDPYSPYAHEYGNRRRMHHFHHSPHLY